MQISLLVSNIYIYISIDTKDRYDEKSVLQRSTYDIPPIAHCHDNNSYNFSDFQLYQVTLPIDPPWYHTVAMCLHEHIACAKKYPKMHCYANQFTGIQYTYISL